MQIFLRAVVTGFGLSLGAAIFKKVARRLGLEEPTTKDDERVATRTPQPVTES